VAVYKYQRQNADELSFEKGCVINVIDKLDPDWWTGELNGQTGVFPSNYVTPLSSVSDFDQLSASATCKQCSVVLSVEFAVGVSPSINLKLISREIISSLADLYTKYTLAVLVHFVLNKLDRQTAAVLCPSKRHCLTEISALACFFGQPCMQGKYTGCVETG